MALVKRHGLVSTSFELTLTQNPKTNDSVFTLEATDNNGDTYATRVEPVSSDPDWVKLLMRRIANSDAAPGWKFDATFDTVQGTGVIDG
jgi:hypothetical protein